MLADQRRPASRKPFAGALSLFSFHIIHLVYTMPSIGHGECTSLRLVLTHTSQVRIHAAMLAQQLRTALDTYQPPQGVRVSHPIEYLFKRKTIPVELYVAAQHFRADYECAIGDSSAPIVNWDSFEQMALTDNPLLQGGRHKSSMKLGRAPAGLRPVIHAKDTLVQVRQHVGPLGFQVARAVCGMGIPIAAVAGFLGVHRDVMSFRLKEVLYDLADFYDVNPEDFEDIDAVC